MVLLQSRNKSPLLPASKGQGRSGKWEYFSWFAPLINGIHPQLGYWLFSCTIYITGEFWDELRRIQTLVVGREEDTPENCTFSVFLSNDHAPRWFPTFWREDFHQLVRQRSGLTWRRDNTHTQFSWKQIPLIRIFNYYKNITTSRYLTLIFVGHAWVIQSSLTKKERGKKD